MTTETKVKHETGVVEALAEMIAAFVPRNLRQARAIDAANAALRKAAVR